MPLDPKLNKFSTASPLIASFTFSELASGTGFLQAYLASTLDSVGDNPLLVENQIYSADIDWTTGNVFTTPFVKIIDRDYDLSAFNYSRTIRGIAYVNLGVAVVGDSGNTSGYFIVKLRKWDGTTETEIANVQSATMPGGAEQTLAIQITVPKTVFKRGETLRATVEGWAEERASGSVSLALGQDPQNRDGTVLDPTGTDVITASVIYLPFEINP